MTLRILVSFHFHRNTNLDAFVERLGGDVDLFADSGAYSAFATGAQIEFTDYVSWLARWDHLFSTVSSLDVIGDPEESQANLVRMRSLGFDDVLPVFHIGESFDVLRQQCDESRYVALGGLVPHLASGAANRNRPQLMRWLIKAHQVARKTGTVLHGFGCTGSLFLKDLPFYSADSSAYLFGRKRSLVYVWDPDARRMRSFHFREQQLTRKRQHLLRLYGLDPGRMLHPEFMVSGTEHFHEDRIQVSAACLRSYVAMEKFLQRWHNVSSPTEGGDTGTKIYFVNTNMEHVDMEPLARVAGEGLL